MHVLGALRLALSSIVIPDDEDREDDEILSPLVSFVHAICEESGEADVGLETNTDALLLRLVTYCRDWNANAHVRSYSFCLCLCFCFFVLFFGV